MHILTGIIVPIDGTELSNEIRNKAEWTLEGYEGVVYDWYNSQGGRWSDEFEDRKTGNVIFGEEPEFLEYVNRLRKNQHNEYNYFLEKLPSADLDDYQRYYEIGLTTDFTTFYLKCFAELLNGDFTSYSYIFDSEMGSAKITESRIEDYKANPEHYAIVLIDCHY